MFLAEKILDSARDGFLCMRRDVSGKSTWMGGLLEFSLHAQRCFLRIKGTFCVDDVFSACAEMFLVILLLHRLVLWFSLHAQRCFRCNYLFHDASDVFSACAEMFLDASILKS